MLNDKRYLMDCLRTSPVPVFDAGEYEGDELFIMNDQALLMCAMGIAGEAGEVADLVKKVEYQDHDFDKEHYLKELGDVLYYLTVGAACVGASLEDVAALNVDKLKKRFPDGFERERSIHRAEGDV